MHLVVWTIPLFYKSNLGKCFKRDDIDDIQKILNCPLIFFISKVLSNTSIFSTNPSFLLLTLGLAND